MDGGFRQSVEAGLKLAKRVYSGNGSSVSAPKLVAGMDRCPALKPTYDPTAPMIYAVISDPEIVDNPESPSYQPYVHGLCDPPALIPLQMNEIAMELDCYFDSAFVSVRGSWRVHCVMASRSCDCRLVVPMGEQGSILGIEIDVAGRSYSTQIVQMEEKQDMEKMSKDKRGGFLRPQIFSLTIPQVYGGTILSVSVSWFQQLLYINGHFSLNVPFIFPEYVTPCVKRFPTREKIQLNVNTGIGTEVICETISHPLKEMRRQVGKLGFLYEADVITWSIVDFCFSYAVSSNDIFGGLLLQSPSIHDFDQREMFCLYIFPGKMQNKKVFSKDVVFLVDISESMRGKPLECAKNALAAGLSNLTSSDSFSIIAFNGQADIFSSTLKSATMETIENATQWMSEHCVSGGGTSILPPLNEAIRMLSNRSDSIPHIFLITDGAVENERNICHIMKTHITSRGSMSPRISTFGIGSYCNHYFLRMLALIGGGHYDAAYDADSINTGMQSLFVTASSAVLRNISIDSFYHLDSFEVYPFPIPDLSSECPLILWGRFQGKFPDSLKLNGISADMTNTSIDMKVEKSKDIPIDKVFAKRQIDVLTAQAWFSESKQYEEKVTKMSIETGFTSEYTRMSVLHTDKQKDTLESSGVHKAKKINLWKKRGSKDHKMAILHVSTVGFGDVIATRENAVSVYGEEKLADSNEILSKVTSCCSRIGYCCCPCFIRACSHVSDQCAVVMAQLCAALSCFGCLNFCMEVCFECDCT